MVDKFKDENEIVKTHAQASGKLKRRPQLQQQAQSPHPPRQRQLQQGDAFGSVGDKPPPKRDKREVVDL